MEDKDNKRYTDSREAAQVVAACKGLASNLKRVGSSNFRKEAEAQLATHGPQLKTLLLALSPKLGTVLIFHPCN